MIAKSRQKIHELRKQPEEVRLRAALTLTATIGVGLIIISLALLLPLQLYFGRPNTSQSTARQDSFSQVSGIVNGLPVSSPESSAQQNQ
jgi:hypothetical protein